MTNDDKLPEPVPLNKELIDKVIEELGKPREPAKPGDPFYEIDQIINRCMMCERDRRDDSAEPCDFCKPKPKYPDNAPDGTIFVCGACGKLAKCIYGDGPDSPVSWDESCMLNAVLVYEDRRDENGLMVAVEGY